MQSICILHIRRIYLKLNYTSDHPFSISYATNWVDIVHTTTILLILYITNSGERRSGPLKPPPTSQRIEFTPNTNTITDN